MIIALRPADAGHGISTGDEPVETVGARLRIDGAMTGGRLGLEVEATDKRGRGPLERNAGTIRVAG